MRENILENKKILLLFVFICFFIMRNEIVKNEIKRELRRNYFELLDIREELEEIKKEFHREIDYTQQEIRIREDEIFNLEMRIESILDYLRIY